MLFVSGDISAEDLFNMFFGGGFATGETILKLVHVGMFFIIEIILFFMIEKQAFRMYSDEYSITVYIKTLKPSI